MLEKLGYELPEILTWDFVWEASEAATKKNADGSFALNGQKVMKPFIYKSSDNMMIQMLRQLDAPYSTARGEVLIFGDVTRSLLFDVAGHAAHGAFTTFKHDSYPGNFFNAGQCLFAVDSTAGATWMGSEAPLMDISADNVVHFDTEVRMIPQFDPDDPKMISQGPSICVFDRKDPQEVLAAWLFAQYLLTNDVQIAYAQTEGYIPVTKKAQDSAEYRDYLSRAGEDGDLYYDVKINASKLLLENIDNTFVTPVFNGSASLRDAAGQMIENVAKSVRRKQTVDDAYMDQLFEDVKSLYRLDQLGVGTAAPGAQDLGPLPKTSVALLSCLGAAWVILGVSVLVSAVRRKKNTNL
jgi:multiple sugar transport system substrate-binding protein